MNKSIETIHKAIEPLRQQIINHKVYSIMDDVEDLKIFMQHHIYAVWDFMSLLKSLQTRLTCTSVPWFPKGSGDIGYLINEIVLGEETDVDATGIRKSHFELYLDAMAQCGADSESINTFLKILQQTNDFEEAYRMANTPQAARAFVDFTFEIITSNKDYLQAAIFTFGREDLIPGMFLSIIKDMAQQTPDQVSIFTYYMERHIEVDGDHHSHLALEMTASLCGDNEGYWREVEAVVIRSLQQRINLWDGVYQQLIQRKENRKLSLT
ncbi:DUF3050 domain-containing protein [Spirosoma daeguense]